MCLLVAAWVRCAGQSSDEVRIRFAPVWGAQAILLSDSAFEAGDAQLTRIEVLRFYISRVRLLHQGRVVIEEVNSYHLLDAADTASLSWVLHLKKHFVFDELQFCLGIDSATNVSGALGGDLDPTRGMYWAWQSGYINLKVEGSSLASKARNQTFQYHLGGYLPPFYALQQVSVRVPQAEQVCVQLDLQKVLSATELGSQDHIMSPCAAAVRLSQTLSGAFSLQAQ